MEVVLYPWVTPGKDYPRVPPTFTSHTQPIVRLPVVCLSCRHGKPIASPDRKKKKNQGERSEQAPVVPKTENRTPICWMGQGEQAKVQQVTCAPDGQLLTEYWKRYFGNVTQSLLAYPMC